MSVHVVSETERCPVCGALQDLIDQLRVERYTPTPPRPERVRSVVALVRGEQDRSHG